jgi:hypothetical protein
VFLNDASAWRWVWSVEAGGEETVEGLWLRVEGSGGAAGILGKKILGKKISGVIFLPLNFLAMGILLTLAVVPER